VTTPTRREATQRLTRLGVEDPTAVLEEIADAADPALALRALERLIEASAVGDYGDRARLLDRLGSSAPLRRQLTRVLGVSQALGDHLVVQAMHGNVDWSVLDTEAAGDEVSHAYELDRSSVASLRRHYRRELLRIAARDLVGDLPVTDTVAELSELADATLHAALTMVDAEGLELAVFAMGKCGARELNYVSDVDVLFVGTDAEHTPLAIDRARRVMSICREVAWQIDVGLRPEGHRGLLVRSVDSYRAYYERWADSWEFQALLKARWVASSLGGDAATDDFATAWEQQITPMVWTAGARPQFVADAQAMRRRVASRADAEHDIKLGPGGLRDIEFAVQLLQLVHGQSDATLRTPATVDALTALTAGGYVGRTDGAELRGSYCFLRSIEHRLQLRVLRRTHRLPTAPEQLRWLARSLGYHRIAGVRGGDPAELFLSDWRRHRREVRRLHEKLFYRPLLAAVARLPSEAVRMAPAAAQHRLAALGFADPPGALRHVSALTVGVSRRAAIQQALLPVILDELAKAADPDAGLLAYRRLSEQLGKSPWYLRLMRDGQTLAPRVAAVLGGSRYIANLLERDAQGLSLLANDADLAPRPAAALHELFVTTARRAVTESSDADEASLRRAVAAVRRLRRHELLRIAAADVCGLLDITEVGRALSDVADATVAGALEGASVAAARQHGGVLPVVIAVIGMGRLGGQEMSYASDCDVLFICEPIGDADASVAGRVATGLMRALAEPGPDPALGLDARLRPEGVSGTLVPSLTAYRRYYQERAQLWEAQALLRARIVAGDDELAERFMALADGLRYPSAGLDRAGILTLRRMKARVETERLPRGADPTTHLKFGRGGLVDIEWAVQLLQLSYGYTHPVLRTPRTLEALRAMREAGLIDRVSHDVLAESWQLVARIRNAVTLVRGSASDQLPRSPRELLGVMKLSSGGSVGKAGEFMDGYLRTTRRAHVVVDRVLGGVLPSGGGLAGGAAGTGATSTGLGPPGAH
jgi:glutamate-ammonia-ligase adenylyltransferase